MDDLLKLTSEKVDKVVNLIQENLLPDPDDELRVFWNKIGWHYIHYQTNYANGKKELDKSNSDNIIAGCKNHYQIASDIINKRQR